MRFLQLFFSVCVILLVSSSCKQDVDFTEQSDAILSFSTDTIQFDTVFTTIGSTTKSFRFFNPNDKAVKTTIQLNGGDQSNFRLNIDGLMTTNVTDYEIMGKDSLFIFVEVTVDPQNSNSPMVIEDVISFYTNGNEQDVKLVAYGQDVHLYNDEAIGSQTWLADKPYLIYNSILIDSLNTLTIEAGAQLHFHHNSSMIVAGTVKSLGTLERPVVFQGDRLEQDYLDIPGQWGATGIDANGNPTELGGILILPGSIGNVIDHTIIRNARFGLQVLYSQGFSDEKCLTLSNSTIQNFQLLGLFAVTSNIEISNSVFSDCGYQAMFIIGGNTDIFHTTVANYYPSSFESRENPSIQLKNYSSTEDEIFVYPMHVLFANSIIDGQLENELEIDEYSSTETPIDFLFDHCLMKLDDDFDISSDVRYKNVIRVKSPDSLPNYVDKSSYDYRLDTLSIAKDKGKLEYGNLFPFDLDGNSRVDDLSPDIGAFERIEGSEPEKN